jgi:PD-(D/E)XK endonuclease
LIAESDSGLQRVQVKTGSNSSRVGITRAPYGAGSSPSTGKYGRRPYEASEIDLFFIYLATGEKYLIPLSAVEGLRALALARYAKYQLTE